TAGHLAVIREYIAACAQAAAPYVVTDDLHRSVHKLSGTAKTAGARQGIKIAEPLNRYIRKLYDHSAGLPAAGLEALQDAVNAIRNVVENINEDTGFFPDHAHLIARIVGLEHALDSEISRMAETVGAMTSVIVDEPDFPVARRAAEAELDFEFPAPSNSPAPQWQPEAESEPQPPEVSTLAMLDWSFKHFPDDAAPASVTAPETPATTEESADSSMEDIVLESAPDMPDSTSALEELVLGEDSEEIVLEEPALEEEASRNDPDFEPGLESNTDSGAFRFEEIEPASSQNSFATGFLTEEELQAQPELDTSPFDELHSVPDSLLVEQAATVVGVSFTPLFNPPAPETSPQSPHRREDALPEPGEVSLEAPLPGWADVPAEPVTSQQDAYQPEFQSQFQPEGHQPEPYREAARENFNAYVEPVPESQPEPAPQPEYRPEPEPAAHAEAAVAVPAEPEGDDVDANFDPDIAAIFTEEASELLEAADSSLSSWMQDRGNTAQVFELKRAIHTLKGGARMAGIRAMGDLSHELETFMQRVEDGQVPATPEVFSTLQSSLDELNRMRDVVSSGGRSPLARDLMARIRALGGYGPAVEEPARVELPPVAASAEPASYDYPQHSAPAFSVQESAPPPYIDYDASVEQSETFAPAEETVGEAASLDPVALQPATDESMEIEAEFGADELGAAAPREAVRVEDHAAQIDSEQHVHEVAAQAPELEPDRQESDAVEAPAISAVAPIQAPALPPGREPVTQERQEFARVDADLLDTLLNNAGEVSIFRSRLEQQVSSIEFNLAELGRTVTRLRDQLRKLELETEAEILHRHQEEFPDRTDFDPLEMDRYSTIQQLTRAFAESVSDVGSIEGLLENLTREAQNLLLQQSRVVTELQNGLMRTRMVPFQRHVQRLSRLVRQVASDTGKRCDLVVVGASGELDRQVLERMLPPFEHMLRNSVVHGIETPQERLARGKVESGTIKVGLHREGSEMVIVLEDDGRGIDVKAVRERAAARGLLQAGRVLSDEEAMQLILEPGFSTASSITQHAGRGVGMDVVVTEIKKLGGALFTSSVPGQGVKFTIRLPFTLAITQALIVRTGDEIYAMPLPTVEGVARVPKSDVQKHLAEEVPTFNYGGQIYRLQHLGAFVGGGPSQLPEADVSVPLILIRAGEHSTALVCDELVGSREMVVKAVGPQIATIRGISGATILGDGRIVVILDMGALVRSEWRSRKNLEVQGPVVDRRTFALVVDDSITVRRVTQRFLERNGMKVMTAKDGVDALSILQEHLPDVILLDIEMPRMDGYELASHVRADARTSDIPIVMITSRVGEKHRARAIELGVNDYLGKPYQENELLDAIEPLVEARRQRQAS
ncbi:MAG: response regulator, partial [Steroidobacteraceae bacterium]